jgi:RNA-directed DNA polymerase
MTDINALARASGTTPAELTLWGELISIGSGFTRVSIPQRRRRPRDVLMPSLGLDRLLKQLSSALSNVTGYVPPPEVHGFVQGRSIVTNASAHLNKDIVLRLDIRDFFGTIDDVKHTRALRAHGLDHSCADALAAVTLVGGSLAQGFSTSPLLSNIAFLETDQALVAESQRAGVCYTRYVDDLTFSGDYGAVNDEFMAAMGDLLDRHGWTVNQTKTRFMRRGKPQFVTGLYVGDSAGPHIPRSMKRLLRRELYFASRFGLEDSYLRSPTPILANRMGGWVHYAAHADPAVGLQLRDRWRHVSSSQSHPRLNQDWDLLLDEIRFPRDW